MDRLLALRSSELLVDVSEEHARMVEGLAQERRCSEGDVVFRLGEEATNLYVIVSGNIDLTFPLRIMGEAKEVRFHTLDPGQAFAWSALVPPYKMTMSARSATDSLLLALPRQAMMDLFQREPALGLTMMSNVARVVALRLNEQQALWVREVQRNVSRTYR